MKQRTGNCGQTTSGVRLKTGLSLAVAAATVALGSVNLAARAQTVVPVPIVSNLIGIAPGGSVTACSSSVDIPTFAVSPGPVHYGDGCLANQATLSAPYSVSTDSLGNAYISDYSHFALRVLYNGGTALAAAIVAANPNVSNLVPQPGYVYTLAGGSRQGAISKTGSPLAYYCNSAGSGPVALNSAGNGCPGAEAEVKPRTAAIDANGNIFFPNISGGTEIKVIFVGGTAAANLITLENPGVTPQPGYVYDVAASGTQGWSGDGGLATVATVNSLRSVAIDANENLYITDGNTTGSPANVNVRKVTAATGIMTTLAGSAGCAYPEAGTTGCPQGTIGGNDGDNGPATSATYTAPYGILADANGNVYVADVYNARVRVIYQGSGNIINVSNPQSGYIYTVAGGGATSAASASASGTLATQLAFGQVQSIGMDSAGNLYIYDVTNKFLWEVNAKTGIATILGGLGPIGVAATSGNFCVGTVGPKSTDNLADGCPATQAVVNVSGEIVFDAQGNIYVTDGTNNVVRRLSFNTQFLATPVGSSTTQPVAFTTVNSATVTAENFTLENGATSEFSDAGNDTCALNSSLAADTTCVFNVKFAPAQAGLREGSMAFAGTNLSSYLGGVGQAASVSVDPGTQTTIGTSLKPNGVGTDLLGNLYISDSTSNTVKKVAASGGTPTTLISGLNKPAQVAVDGAGNVYVADTGNNRIAMTAASGGSVTALGTGLSAPAGVAVDALGNVYVSDTGNNRVVRISANGGQQTLALSGLSSPAGLALDAAGDLFVADKGNSRVVELGVSASQTTVNLGTTTFAPSAVAVDAAGDLYVTDATNLQVLTYAFGSTNASTIMTGLTAPVGIAVDVNGSIYVADTGATGAVALNRTLGNITYPVTNVLQTNLSPIKFTDTGNQPLVFTGTSYASNVTAPFSLASASANGCLFGLANAIPTAGSCLVTASFAPTVAGNDTDTIAPITSAANNANVSAVLSGLAIHLTSTSTTINVTSPTTSTYYYGQTLTITATTTLTANVGTPTGSFMFTVDGAQQPAIPFGATSTSTTSLTATITLPNLTVGAHSVSVSEIFTAPPYLYASSGATLNFSVLKALTTGVLTAVPTSSGASVSTTFTATFTPGSGSGETGTVSFYSGSTLLNPSPMTINSTTGVASYVSSSTVFPSNSFTAVYSGDSNFSGSTSSTLQPAGNFNLTTPATVVSIPQGGNITNNIVLTPYFGYSGTITPTCSGLPAYSSCSFQPVNATVSGTAQVPFTIYIYTNTNLTSENRQGSRVTLAMLSPLGLLALAFARRKKLLGSKVLLTLLIALSIGAATGLSGCTNPVERAYTFIVTPASTQTVKVTLADNGSPQVSHSINFTLNVCNINVGTTCQTF